MTTTQDVIRAAASVGRDVAEGRLEPSELDGAVADECRTLFGTVAGPEDALWSVHLNVARQVLALGGVPADELSEWLAVARRRALAENGAVEPSAASDASIPPVVADHPDSSAGVAHSPR